MSLLSVSSQQAPGADLALFPFYLPSAQNTEVHCQGLENLLSETYVSRLTKHRNKDISKAIKNQSGGFWGSAVVGRQDGGQG